MNSIYGKVMRNLFLWMALTNLVLVSVLVFADNDFDNPSVKSPQSYGYPYTPNLYVEKKLSEFLGGPGKRSDYDDYYTKSKRLSEFLGGPGKKRFAPSRNAIEKRLSEFLGGPGK